MSPLTPPSLGAIISCLSPCLRLWCVVDNICPPLYKPRHIRPLHHSLSIWPHRTSPSGIMDLSSMLMVFSLVAGSGAFDLGQTTRCVPVPHQMSVCQDVPYSEMRLPNLLGHSSVEEALPRSEEWKTLLHTGCHPQARAFVCSLIAPVCLDRYVQRGLETHLSSQVVCFLL